MKNKLKLILLICALFGTSYYFSTDVKNKILTISDVVISSVYSSINSIYLVTSRYFNQASTIKELQEKTQELAEYELLYKAMQIDYNSLLEANKINKYDFKTHLVRVLSYEEIDNPTKFWMDFQQIKEDKSYGLVYDNAVVGIMYNKNNRANALSLTNEKCAFSVVVGRNKVPAIVQGYQNKVYVNFITDYEQINIGDIVYTSGMDMMFAGGIYVGKVKRIIDEAGYKRALLEDVKDLKPYRYVYAIDIN